MIGFKQAIGHFKPGSRHKELAMEPAAQSRRVSPFSLAASPGVLVLLDIVTGLELSITSNTEAIIGFLAELKVEGGLLRGSSGNMVTAEACLGFLARLGANTGVPLSVRESLKLCEQIGLTTKHPTAPGALFRDLLHGSQGRLDRHIQTLEARGYRLRQSNRLFTTCHAVTEETAQPLLVRGRLFTRPMLPIDLAIAA